MTRPKIFLYICVDWLKNLAINLIEDDHFIRMSIPL